MGSKDNLIVRLKCAVKNYDWGKTGRESSVARLCAKNSGEEIRNDNPYAEFWMGTHDSAPSYVVAPKRADDDLARENGGNIEYLSLKEWIQQNPSVLGDKVRQRWGSDLPFLFKVLSVEKALSIQAHPDKNLAEVLHKQLPELYRDDNHKPEMALAVTPFEALCGFISLEELQRILLDVPEIIEVVGISIAHQVLHITKLDEEKKRKGALQSLFTELMTAKKPLISEEISKLVNRLSRKSEVEKLTNKEQLVLLLEKQYPSDVGVLAAFLLNHVKLNPGEALYLGANEPHAYISGECVECMASSDNVVRAGLTPKTRDVQSLCSMLTYKQDFPEILFGVVSNSYTRKYIPPFDEFEVDRCILPGETSTVFAAVPGPAIFVIMSGEGMMCRVDVLSKELVAEGDVLFVPANTEIIAVTLSGLNLYRAGVSTRFFERSDINTSN